MAEANATTTCTYMFVSNGWIKMWKGYVTSYNDCFSKAQSSASPTQLFICPVGVSGIGMLTYTDTVYPVNNRALNLCK